MSGFEADLPPVHSNGSCPDSGSGDSTAPGIEFDESGSLSLDCAEDRYSRLRLIHWWDQERLARATVMVVGAGAIGNELIKDLALLGVGRVLIVDMDEIEHTNLSRSVLYRAHDVGRSKAEVAAERASEMNPDVLAQAAVSNVIDDIGLGVFRRMDVVLGGLDNREARLSINESCYRVGVPWIDGAIEVLNGIARVFVPPEGVCYECTMTDVDWELINRRKSCAMLTHEQLAEGKVPTTPTSSAIIAGIQVQEMLKLLHADRELPTLSGRGYIFNGVTHDSYVVEYQRKHDCMSHDIYGDIEEMPWSSRMMTLAELLSRVRERSWPDAVIDLDRDIATTATCACGETRDLFLPVHKMTRSALDCVKCGQTMRFEMTHTVDGTEGYLERTPFEVGLPLLHIIGARSGLSIKYFEFTGDADEVLRGLELGGRS